MSDTRSVFISRLTMGPPGTLIFHAIARRMWDRTECGRSISHERRDENFKVICYHPDMVPCRRDIAELIGRPCTVCRWRGW